MSRKWKITLIVGVIAMFTAYASLMIWLIAGSSTPGGSIALIRIDGVISGSGEGPFSSSVTPERVLSQLRQADEDPGVSAILLRINSPGGTAGASQEIYSEVVRMKKPVVASIADIGASGAYWIAAGADKIIANNASEIGSIGVIIEIPNLQGLFKQIGADFQVVKQGKYKDMGNPARPLTAEERTILDKHSKVLYDLFVEEVAKARKMKKDDVLRLANGLTYPGTQAKGFKLIDEIGNYSDAVAATGKLGKIDGKPNVVEYDKPGLFDFFSGMSDVSAALKNLSQIGKLNDMMLGKPVPR